VTLSCVAAAIARRHNLDDLGAAEQRGHLPRLLERESAAE
jgi:hypothetical protein